MSRVATHNVRPHGSHFINGNTFKLNGCCCVRFNVFCSRLCSYRPYTVFVLSVPSSYAISYISSELNRYLHEYDTHIAHVWSYHSNVFVVSILSRPYVFGFFMWWLWNICQVFLLFVSCSASLFLSSFFLLCVTCCYLKVCERISVHENRFTYRSNMRSNWMCTTQATSSPLLCRYV